MVGFVNINAKKVYVTIFIDFYWNIVSIFVTEQMTCDSDPEMGGAVQLMYIIRDLLDPENMLGAVNNKQEKTDFLNYFYKHCMHVLIGM